MPDQDSRMTERAKKVASAFFTFIATNQNSKVQQMLEMEPTLVYARDNTGSTAVSALIVSGEAADLETLRVVMRYNPDLTMRDNDGHDAATLLQVNAGSPLNHLFAREIGVNIPDSAHTMPASPVDSVALAREYLNSAEVKRSEETFRKIEQGAKVVDKKKTGWFWKVEHDDTDAMKNVFVNMEQQKELNRINEESGFYKTSSFNNEIDQFLENFQVFPSNPLIMGFDKVGGSDNSLIIIPEKFYQKLGELYDYFFGDSQE